MWCLEIIFNDNCNLLINFSNEENLIVFLQNFLDSFFDYFDIYNIRAYFKDVDN